MIRVAVIGVGAIGKHHARIYNELEGVELVAVAEPDEGRRLAVTRRLKIPGYADYNELFDKEQVDAASITVPTGLHHAAALAALKRGLHVLVEKPLASTEMEAQEIIEAASGRGLTLTVGHVERFNPAIVELKRRLVGGQLGRIFQVQSHRLSPFPHYVMDVGVVLDLATHELDIMCYVVGSEIDRLYAEIGRRVHTRHEDMLSGILHFDNGVVGVLDINWLTPTKVRQLRVTGERGMFVVDYLQQDLHFYENSEAPSMWDTLALFSGVEEGNVLKLRVSKEEPLQAELRAFVEVVKTNATPRVSGADGLRALRLAHLLIASGQQGRVLHPHEHLAGN